eukprot:3314644-Amphidinium_carterae.1
MQSFEVRLGAECRGTKDNHQTMFQKLSQESPYVLQHACFTINMLVSQSTDTWCTLTDTNPITVNKLAIRNNEQKVDAIWHGKTTNSGEHIGEQWKDLLHAKFDKNDTRSTMEIFGSIDIPPMDKTMDADYVEEDHIGKAIIEQVYTKTRLTQKQLEHRLWVKNKEVQQPPDPDNNQGQRQEEHITTDDTIPQPPGLDISQRNYVHPRPHAMCPTKVTKLIHSKRHVIFAIVRHHRSCPAAVLNIQCCSFQVVVLQLAFYCLAKELKWRCL